MSGEVDPGGIVVHRRQAVGRRLAEAGLALAMVLAAASGPAAAQDKPDRYVGYYYPRPAAVEVYKARAAVLPGAYRTPQERGSRAGTAMSASWP